MARSRMRVESTCIRQIKKKTGATIFLNRMALPLVVPQCEVGGAAPDEICVLLLQFLSSWVLAHTCTAIDANGQAMRMVRRCEWSGLGDANGQAMQMAMRRGIAAIAPSACRAGLFLVDHLILRTGAEQLDLHSIACQLQCEHTCTYGMIRRSAHRGRRAALAERKFCQETPFISWSSALL